MCTLTEITNATNPHPINQSIRFSIDSHFFDKSFNFNCIISWFQHGFTMYLHSTDIFGTGSNGLGSNLITWHTYLSDENGEISRNKKVIFSLDIEDLVYKMSLKHFLNTIWPNNSEFVDIFAQNGFVFIF